MLTLGIWPLLCYSRKLEVGHVPFGLNKRRTNPAHTEDSSTRLSEHVMSVESAVAEVTQPPGHLNRNSQTEDLVPLRSVMCPWGPGASKVQGSHPSDCMLPKDRCDVRISGQISLKSGDCFLPKP